MSSSKWMLAAALAVGLAGSASADVGFSIGVGGRNGNFGFNYGRPAWGGGYYGGHRHYHHPGHHHHHHGSGWGVSVQAYQPAPRYYQPTYVYPAPRTVVVPAPTYVVPQRAVVVPGYVY